MTEEEVDTDGLIYDRAEAWKLLSACPNFYSVDEAPRHKCLVMSDVWAWACSDSIELTDDNVTRIAELYNRYGFCGLLYYQVEVGEWLASEFKDNNRFIQFVQNEERIRKEVEDYNKRGYHQAEYTIDGKIGVKP